MEIVQYAILREMQKLSVQIYYRSHLKKAFNYLILGHHI